MSKSGKGPGELQFPLALAQDPKNNLYVLDVGNLRVSVYGEHLNFVKEVPLPTRAFALAVVGDSQIVIGAALRSGMEMGPPVHALGPQGKVTRSFGIPMGPTRGDQPLIGGRTIAASPGGSLGIARLDNYIIELYESSGSSYVLRREADWYLPPTKPGSTNAMISGLWFDDANHRLWVTIVVRKNPNFIPGPDDFTNKPEAANLMHGTRIEVFDLRNRRLIASKYIDASAGLTPGGELVLPHVTAGGEMNLVVARKKLSELIKEERP